jgi:flagellar biosynthesis protein FlhF
MELKRILARDTRSATEQAIALYGREVLIISNHRVGGQTELVIALDVVAASEEVDAVADVELVQAMPQKTVQPVLEKEMAEGLETAPSTEFDEHLVQALKFASKSAASAETLMSSDAKDLTPAMSETELARENARGKEIVSLVIDEISALRQEIRMNQKVSAWEAQQHWPEHLQSLVNNLCEAPVPSALRTLLLSGLKEQNSIKEAQASLKQQLLCNIHTPVAGFSPFGLHALAGSSGAGKTLMTVRWAQTVAQEFGSAKVAVISYQDERAGAWSQIQQLCAQAEVDCYRAANADSLHQLMRELSSRQLVLIDTSGVQMSDRLAEILDVQPNCQLHAVLPVDASTVTLNRVLSNSGFKWQSMMLTKFDESSAPWPLIQFLSNAQVNLTLTMGSESDKLTHGVLTLSPDLLVDLAIARCMPLKEAETARHNIDPVSSEMNRSSPEINTSRPAWQTPSPILVTHG